MKNYPIVLINTVLSPLSFLVLITLVSGGSLFAEAIEGGLIMTMFSSGTALQGDLSHLKNDFRLQDMIVGLADPRGRLRRRDDHVGARSTRRLPWPYWAFSSTSTYT